MVGQRFGFLALGAGATFVFVALVEKFEVFLELVVVDAQFFDRGAEVRMDVTVVC